MQLHPLYFIPPHIAVCANSQPFTHPRCSCASYQLSKGHQIDISCHFFCAAVYLYWNWLANQLTVARD